MAQGWRGPFGLSASSIPRNTDDSEFTAAGRLTYCAGLWMHVIGFAAEYSEASDVKSEQKFFATYEVSHYFTA